MVDASSTDSDEWPPREYREVIESGLPVEAVHETINRIRRRQHPKAIEAILEDARVFYAYRAEPPISSKREAAVAAVKLCWQSDAFLSLAFYRVRCRLKQLGVPVLPGLLHKMSVAMAQVCIGDPVLIQPGIYIPHGQVVIDGFVDIGKYVLLAPWVGIGLEMGHLVGAKVSQGVYFATGSKLIGPVRVGAFSQVAANSVVIHDVPERTTVAGSPARVIGASRLRVRFPGKPLG